MTRAEKIAHNKLERRLNANASKALAGIPIDIFDIPKIAAIGRDAMKAGADDATAIAAMKTAAEAVRKGT